MAPKLFSWKTVLLPARLIALSFVLLCSACENSHNRDNAQNSNQGQTRVSKIPENVYRNIIPLHELSINNDLEALGDLSDKLFGQFHQERASYYLIDDPSIYVGSSRVKTLTLYFVDNVLLKKKYELTSPIDGELLQSYGNCAFEPLTSTADSVAKAIPSILTVAKKIDPAIDSYRLKWRKEYFSIQYQADNRGTESLLTLIEEHNSYRTLLQSAERGL